MTCCKEAGIYKFFKDALQAVDMTKPKFGFGEKENKRMGYEEAPVKVRRWV